MKQAFLFVFQFTCCYNGLDNTNRCFFGFSLPRMLQPQCKKVASCILLQRCIPYRFVFKNIMANGTHTTLIFTTSVCNSYLYFILVSVYVHRKHFGGDTDNDKKSKMLFVGSDFCLCLEIKRQLSRYSATNIPFSDSAQKVISADVYLQILLVLLKIWQQWEENIYHTRLL